jgi:2-methylcitrate dehydratase PrpD
VATVLGTGGRTTAFNAALGNGYLGHLQDYDDTHLPSILHPSSVVWPAVLAASETKTRTGLEALTAFILGAEAACRVAMSVHPWHYAAGWHITGTVGAVGAAAGSARSLGLPTEATLEALGLSLTSTGGIREGFGSMAKALNAARAASSGLQAAELAAEGFTAAPDVLGGRRGFWAVLSPGGHRESALLDGLGVRWELGQNGLKPFANGVVAHPLEDAMIRLRRDFALRPDDVTSIHARVHPLVLELMDRPRPVTGLEAKFSFQHCAAVALIHGSAHDAQFDDAVVTDPVVTALRDKVTAKPDSSISEDGVVVHVERVHGPALEIEIEHAVGSAGNPLSDDALEDKYRALVEPRLGSAQATSLLERCWHLETAKDVSGVLPDVRWFTSTG